MVSPFGDMPVPAGPAQKTQTQASPFGDAPVQAGGQPRQDTMQIRDVVSQAISNTPKSAAQFIKDLVTPIAHPIETTKAVASLGQGVVEKMIPGRQDNEQIVDDMVDALGERYGGIENIKRTIAEDPVGFVGDLAGVITGGGAAIKGLGALSKVKGITSAGRVATKIGGALEPVTGVGKLAKVTASKIIPKNVPSNLYESAAKFSTVIPEKDRLKLSKTALDNAIMPTAKGLDSVREKINEFNTKITGLIDDATEAGEKIPVNALFKEFGQLRGAISSEPIARRSAIKKVAKDIHRDFTEIRGKDFLTPREAQALKQDVYKTTEGYYNSLKNSPARVEAKHAVARAAKDSLEKIFPEIKELNRKEGALIDLKKQLEKSASRIANRDLIGIGVPIKGSLGAATGGPIGAAAMAGIGMLDTPKVKARLAIVANRLREKGIMFSEDSNLSKFLNLAPGEAIETHRQAGRLQQMENE